MAFPTRSAMLMHMKRHAVRANRVMLKCPEAMCPAKFVTKAQLIIHINSHHPHVMEKQYSEGLCRIQFCLSVVMGYPNTVLESDIGYPNTVLELDIEFKWNEVFLLVKNRKVYVCT